MDTQPSLIGGTRPRSWWERPSAATLRAELAADTGTGGPKRRSEVRIERIGVVVPANNEQDALPSCLNGLRIAACAVEVPVTVIVVLDSCTDSSAEIVAEARGAAELAVTSITVTARNVGLARHTGMVELLRLLPEDGTWLATTDADSIVPPRWFAAQLAHARAGARVVAGTVTVVDWQDRSMAARERALRDYHATSHPHIHGANLSFVATAYQEAGGFPPVTSGEDVALVDAFRSADEPIAWAMDLPVTTSARRHARAPQGFSGYLTALESSFADTL